MVSFSQPTPTFKVDFLRPTSMRVLQFFSTMDFEFPKLCPCSQLIRYLTSRTRGLVAGTPLHCRVGSMRSSDTPKYSR